MVNEYLDDNANTDEEIALIEEKQEEELKYGANEQVDAANMDEDEVVERIVRWRKDDIIESVDNVLYDSEEDPHYSAVGLCNAIKRYLRYMELTTGRESTVSKFLEEAGYSKEQIDLIEKKRAIESEYYYGEQL